MSGKHQLDAQRADSLVQRVARHARPLQPRQRLVDRSRLRRCGRIALVGTTSSYAMVLFGDIGEIQEVRESPRNRERLSERHGRQLVRQLVERLTPLTGRSSRLCRIANLLDPLVECVSCLMTERLPQQGPEQPHVVAQRLVRIVTRGRRLGFD